MPKSVGVDGDVGQWRNKSTGTLGHIKTRASARPDPEFNQGNHRYQTPPPGNDPTYLLFLYSTAALLRPLRPSGGTENFECSVPI